MIFHLLLVAFILFYSFDACSSSDDPHWDYGALGPDVWSDFYPACGGTSQSPVNIKTACTKYQSYAPFQFSSTYSATQSFTLINNGHSISGTQVDKTTYPLTLTGGGLSEPFTFANFHLHWGENYKSGSEHQINSQKYAGEIHFVHANAAQTQYAVLGFFMQASKSTGSYGHRKKRNNSGISSATKSEWEKYFAAANQLDDTNSTTTVNFRLSSLIGTNLNNFYRYAGSLTTPPCTEYVTWTVFQTPIDFTDAQLSNFRANIFFEDYRSPQPLYERTVYRNFQNTTMSTIPDDNLCVTNEPK